MKYISIKRCPFHKMTKMVPLSHQGISGQYHTDYKCPKCFNVICPELSPKLVLREAGVYISKKWHGEDKWNILYKMDKVEIAIGKVKKNIKEIERLRRILGKLERELICEEL